ncbi:hypothetical protein ABZS81_12720 [Streptomyces sp. NPDC005318]|uniref:hypothetical protein n=1 Tax=Streptomyces sp. NPDC005318 TaxID=3157031 RepID=UPI0033A25E92
MRKTASFAMAIAATAAATGLAIAPAHAAGWNVTGNTNADGHYNATASPTTLTDTNTGATLTCSSATATGQLPNGAASGSPLATITSTTWNSCSGPLGITFTVQQNGIWNINAAPPLNASGGVDGTIDNVSAHITGSLCSADVTGGVPATYDNNGHLVVHPTNPPSLTISNVSGCLGLLNNGDTVAFDATYNVAPSTIRVSVA